jgi:hypothetical protein
MTDPVSRAAKRQNLLDRLAEHLTEWGCPPDVAPARVGALLVIVEEHGWTLPTVDAPPLSGRGSTEEGRARARRIVEHTRAGCTCGIGLPFAEQVDAIGALPDQHPSGCPVAVAHELGTVSPC